MSATLVATNRPVGAARPLLAVGLSFVLANLDATVVNVATATIGKNLHTSVSDVGWVVNGYILTFAGFLLLAGDLAARFGARRVYLTGVAVFTLASVAAGLAPTGGLLITARLIQGAGAALFQPASLMLLNAAFPLPVVRTKMIGLWAAMGASAAGLGPVIGGVLVTWLSWRSIFWVNLPVGVVTVLLTVAALPHAKDAPDKPIKIVGHILVAVFLGGIAFVLMEGPALGWSSASVLAATAVAVISGIAFLLWQRQSAQPVYPARLFRNRPFTLMNLVGTLMNLGLFGAGFMLALFLQSTRHATALQAGLQILPMMLVFVIGNILFTRAADRLGTRLPIIGGLTLSVVATLALVLVLRTDTSYWLLAVLVSLANFGLGTASPAMTATMMSSVEQRDIGTAGAMLNVNRQFGSLIGIAIMTGFLTTSSDWYSSARLSYLVAGAAYLAALVCGALLPATTSTKDQ